MPAWLETTLAVLAIILLIPAGIALREFFRRGGPF